MMKLEVLVKQCEEFLDNPTDSQEAWHLEAALSIKMKDKRIAVNTYGELLELKNKIHHWTFGYNHKEGKPVTLKLFTRNGDVIERYFMTKETAESVAAVEMIGSYYTSYEIVER